MSGDAPITWLMLFTLAAGVVVAAGFLIAFLRSRHNREIAAHALAGDNDTAAAAPSGAGAELGALTAIALIAMGLLAFGYRSHPGAALQTSNQLATERTNPDAPKPYQPADPAPDQRVAPTGSTTGSGASSGGRPEGAPER